MSWCTGSSS